MRTFTKKDFANTLFGKEKDAYRAAKTDAKRASVILRNYEWVHRYSIDRTAPLELVRECLQAGAAVNSKDIYGRTALMLAAYHGRTDCIKLLIEAGADVDDKDSDGRTALTIAVDRDHTECVKLLKYVARKCF